MNLAIIRFCVEEVIRQRAETEAVLWMIEAWHYATVEHRRGQVLDVNLIRRLGGKVEPKNLGGYRSGGVRVGPRLCPSAEQVPQLMEDLFTPVGLNRLTPEDVYKRFEEIHPFWDGNGRTGKIIYNWLLGRLLNPQMPPNFWNCSNP